MLSCSDERVSFIRRVNIKMPWSWQRKFTCKNMSRRGQNTHCFLEDLLVANKKWIQISSFHSSDLRTDFNNAARAVSVFYCEAVKPADKIKTQESLNKRLIKKWQRRTGLIEKEPSLQRRWILWTVKTVILLQGLLVHTEWYIGRNSLHQVI